MQFKFIKCYPTELSIVLKDSEQMQTLISIIYTTVPSIEVAEKLAQEAVETNKAACVNIIPAATSFYRWEGKVEKFSECIMIFKTANAHQKELTLWLKKHHPYEVPAIFSGSVHTVADFYAYVQNNSRYCEEQ